MALELVPCKEGTRCLSCHQTPNDIEKDLLPERVERVHWERKAKDTLGRVSEKSIHFISIIYNDNITFS